MSLVITGAQGPANILVQNGSLSHSVSVVLPSGGAAFNTLLYLSSTVGTKDGIFEISGTDSNGDVAFAGAFGKCALNCCVAKKVDSLLGCDCGCNKCNNTLIQAERVNLLTVGIESDLMQIQNNLEVNAIIYETAKKKYNKALELCSDSCGCNC